MKALSKDRNRRYESASDFARDIERHLDNEPVIAGPPTTAYRLRKFVARNRSLVATAGLLAVTFVGVVGLGIAGTVQIRKERSEAVRQAEIAEKRRVDVERAFGKYSNAVVEKALIAAVAGDLVDTRDAIRDARTAGVEESFLSFVEAMAELFGGDQSNAVSLLEGIVDNDPKNLKGWALLFNANRHRGDLNGYAKAERMVEDLIRGRKQLDDYELLFVGYALADTHVHQADGVAKLTQLVQRRPSWGLARAMLAHALANLAGDFDQPDAIVAAKSAAAHRAGLQAVICVGETLTEREDGTTLLP